jgi:hypothetical protein
MNDRNLSVQISAVYTKVNNYIFEKYIKTITYANAANLKCGLRSHKGHFCLIASYSTTYNNVQNSLRVVDNHDTMFPKFVRLLVTPDTTFGFRSKDRVSF